jgi:hypothetical protein
MNKSYVIQWKSTINGRAGKGTKAFELEEATRLAEELNRGYPGIHHEVVETSLRGEANPMPEPAEATNEANEADPAAETETPAEVSTMPSPDLSFSA